MNPLSKRRSQTNYHMFWEILGVIPQQGQRFPSQLSLISYPKLANPRRTEMVSSESQSQPLHENLIDTSIVLNYQKILSYGYSKDHCIP